MSKGAQISTTTLTEECNFEKFQEDSSGDRILLLAWSDKGKLAPYSSKWDSIVGPGWTIASIALQTQSSSPAMQEK